MDSFCYCWKIDILLSAQWLVLACHPITKCLGRSGHPEQGPQSRGAGGAGGGAHIFKIIKS